MPDLVEDNSDDEEDDVDGGGDEGWGPDDDAPCKERKLSAKKGNIRSGKKNVK